jgi:hypothetical protein
MLMGSRGLALVDIQRENNSTHDLLDWVAVQGLRESSKGRLPIFEFQT